MSRLFTSEEIELVRQAAIADARRRRRVAQSHAEDLRTASLLEDLARDLRTAHAVVLS